MDVNTSFIVCADDIDFGTSCTVSSSSDVDVVEEYRWFVVYVVVVDTGEYLLCNNSSSEHSFDNTALRGRQRRAKSDVVDLNILY